MKKNILMIVGVSVSLLTNFSMSSEIVIDDTTKLQWQDNVDTNTTRKEWIDAVRYCEELTLEEYDDWHLPNIRELTSLVDDTKAPPLINSSFKYFTPSSYWSSTTYAGYPSSDAWIVTFYSGNQYVEHKDQSYYVRCVRDGQ